MPIKLLILHCFSNMDTLKDFNIHDLFTLLQKPDAEFEEWPKEYVKFEYLYGWQVPSWASAHEECSASDTSQIFANICTNCFKFDLSLVAKNAQGEVIAIALNALCDYDDDDWKKKNDGNISAKSESSRKEFGDDIRNGPYASKNANRLAVFIDWVERDGGALLAPGTVRRTMKLEIIAVHPENGRLGLASNLLRSSIQLAHSFGCSHLITCATAVASQNLFRKFGFKTIRKVPFHSFFDDGVPIFAGVHDNGEGAELMILSI